jgi:hypothetical protein
MFGTLARTDRIRLAGAVINFVIFELAWLAAVSGGAAGRGLLGSLPALLTVMIHLAFNRTQWKQEVALVAGVTVLGLLVESAFLALGLITYSGTAPGQILPPLWILALWFAFATLPNSSLSWLHGRWLLQVGLGAVFGPLSYLAGQALSAATIPEPRVLPLLVIGIAWALAMPAIYLMAGKLRRMCGDG